MAKQNNRVGVSDILHLKGLTKFAERDRQPVIYFICSGDEVLYVGQSVDFEGRYRSHRQWLEHENVDAIYLLPVDDKDLDFYEKFWIRYFNPPRNIAHTPRHGEGNRGRVRKGEPKCDVTFDDGLAADLSVRAINVMGCLGVKNLTELSAKSAEEVLNTSYCGGKTYIELKSALALHSLKMAPKIYG